MSDKAFEALLRHHEELGLAGKKRRLQHQYVPNEDGTIGNGQIAAALDQLPSPCITLIFEMLPRCRDVFNLAFLSKHLLSHIEPRTDIVIRTAVFENRESSRAHQAAESSGVVGRRWGGVSKKRDLSNLIVTQIADHVRNRAIHVPTALRLLRLLCATRCEKVKDCWGYHLGKDEASNCLGTGQKDPRPFGFAVCSKCTEHCGRKVPNFWQHWVKDEPKVMILGNKHLYHPTANANLGEKIGPILSARHIMQICSSYKADGVEAQKEAFGTMVEEIYGKEGDDKYEEYEKAASTFLRQYDEADEALDAFLQAKEDATAVNRQALYARKKETILQIIEILEEAVEGLPNNLRNLALDHAWREDDTTTPLRFGTPFVSSVLQRFVSAPSYATQKAVDDAVAGIRAKLDILNANPDFLSLAFLEPPENADESQLRSLRERLKQKVRTYLLQNLPSDQTTLQWLAGRSLDHSRWSRPTNYFDDTFFNKIQRNQNRSALLHVLERKHAPLTDIVKLTLVEDGAANLSNLRLLAGKVWSKLESDRRSRQGWGSMFGSYSSFQDQVRVCRSEFRKMKRHAQDYTADPAVVQWIAAQPQGGWGLTRAAAVDSIWDVSTKVLRGLHYHSVVPENIRGKKPYQLLLDRNFAKLLEVHKYYVQQRSTNVH